MRDELVSQVLKEKSLAGNAWPMVNDIEGLQGIWDTLDTFYDRPEKYITEALEPIIKFGRNRAFEHGMIREFYSLLRSVLMGAKRVGLICRLINDQMLPSIIARMSLNDGNQWVTEEPIWIGDAVEDAFWNFVDQKWRDSPNVVAAEPVSEDYGVDCRRSMDG
jgi:hypothetical protein